MGDAAVREVSRLPNLQELRLSYCKSLSDDSIDGIIRNSRSLRFLNLQRCTGITDAGYMPLREEAFRLLALNVLILTDCSFLTDETILSIALGCPQLQVLVLTFCCALTPASLEHLATHALAVPPPPAPPMFLIIIHVPCSSRSSICHIAVRQ